MENIYIYIVSLGCAKNRIDTEHMLGVLAMSNAVIVDEPDDADVIIVNTCGFINEAKQESIDTILEMAKYKEANARVLAVTGCLAQRYAKDLVDELPEVDVFLGVSCYSKICDAIKSALSGKKYVCCERLDQDLTDRVLTTPGHIAYLRIADGCSNNCSYCAIPQIRGGINSRSLKSILSELEDLKMHGISEAILIAQDTTRYGEDFGKNALPKLIHEAAGIMQDGWLRVLYCYPEGVTDELIGAMLEHDNVCRYMDIPVQHFSDNVLKRMNRRNTMASTKNIVKELHDAGFVLRTSLIVGFPGETQNDFKTLVDCIEELKFERLGVFRYSIEEGTAAAGMPNQIPEEIKMERYQTVMEYQEGISQQICQGQLGKKMRVIVDGKDPETGIYMGRNMGQAPQVDGVTYISTKKDLTPGAFHDVLIKDAYEYDLLGEAK
ncbi:MAG: 30S ribosomal protein S12 methylthiotransferase RimO [Christensenellales bacterium]|jgi:ribosomal protein S12 methylthiotransferase